jgi:Zn2+/Cd2+-exporting ATPase
VAKEKTPLFSEQAVAAVLTVLCGLCLAASLVFSSPTASYAAIAFGSVHAVRSAWETLRQRQVDVNTLMLLAAVGSVIVGLPFEAGILLFLFSLSAALELYALGRTASAIEALVKLRPDQARLVGEAGDLMVPVEQIKVGDLVRILPFEAAPLDGQITEGQSSLDEAALTGESVPVSKEPGDLVLAGSQNLAGSLVIRATAVAGNTSLDQTVALVKQAQEDRSSGQKISAWFGSRYTYFVIGVFVVVLIIRLVIGQTWDRAFYASLAVFVSLSPCALVIAAPSASLSALAWAAKNGLLVRGAQVIEESGKVDTLALDKTGTLTQGSFRVFRAWEEGGEEWRGGEWPPRLAEFLRETASIESHSTHPVASALVLACPTPPQEPLGVEVIPGLGVRGIVDGRPVEAGQARLFPEASPEVLAKAEQYQAEGLTVALVKTPEGMAVFGAQDAPRPEAAGALKALRGLGITRVLMLTGDSEPTAKAVAKEMGIQEIHAGLLPADKDELVASMIEKGRRVMVVGDGVNDAPSLARAQVGVAMGGLGSDVALNAAQAILTKDSLVGLVRLRSLGLYTNRVTKGSLLFAAGVVITLFLGSMAADAFLTPEARRFILPIAVLGHEGSTVLVILNGLRLLGGPPLVKTD